MNLIPVGLSLLQAGEQFGSNAKPISPIGEALSALTSGASLKRVTLVAEQPDATVVVVRADYSGPADFAPPDVSEPAPKRSAQQPIDVSWTDVQGDTGLAGSESTTLSRPSGGSTYFNPLWQYTRIQAGSGTDPRGAHLDVRV